MDGGGRAPRTLRCLELIRVKELQLDRVDRLGEFEERDFLRFALALERGEGNGPPTEVYEAALCFVVFLLIGFAIASLLEERHMQHLLARERREN